MYADENVIKIKHEVLFEVAKAAFDGNLDEIRDDIPFKLIPGPIPHFCLFTFYFLEVTFRARMLFLSFYFFTFHNRIKRLLSLLSHSVPKPPSSSR